MSVVERRVQIEVIKCQNIQDQWGFLMVGSFRMMKKVRLTYTVQQVLLMLAGVATIILLLQIHE